MIKLKEKLNKKNWTVEGIMDSVNVLLIDVLIITTYTRQVGILKFECILN